MKCCEFAASVWGYGLDLLYIFFFGVIRPRNDVSGTNVFLMFFCGCDANFHGGLHEFHVGMC